MPKFGFNPSEVAPQEPMSFELLKGEYTLRLRMPKNVQLKTMAN